MAVSVCLLHSSFYCTLSGAVDYEECQVGRPNHLHVGGTLQLVVGYKQTMTESGFAAGGGHVHCTLVLLWLRCLLLVLGPSLLLNIRRAMHINRTLLDACLSISQRHQGHDIPSWQEHTRLRYITSWRSCHDAHANGRLGKLLRENYKARDNIDDGLFTVA